MKSTTATTTKERRNHTLVAGEKVWEQEKVWEEEKWRLPIGVEDGREKEKWRLLCKTLEGGR